MRDKKIYAAISLAALALIVAPVSYAAHGGGAAKAPSVVELEVHDIDSGELVARLLLEEGHRGSVYFDETPRGLGLVPLVHGQDEVTLKVYEVEPVDEQEESVALLKVLRGITRAADPQNRQIDMPDTGKLQITLVAVHQPKG